MTAANLGRKKEANNTTAAFSLMEMAILIVVLTIIMTGSFSFLAIDARQASNTTTYDKLNVIEDALAEYFAVYGRLPCPASPWQSQSNGNFGLEQRQDSGGNIDTCISSANTSVMSASLDNDLQYLGTIPTRTLGLADDYMFDGWGRRFGYAVQRIFINNSDTNTLCVTGDNAAVDHTTTDKICFRGQAAGGSNLLIKDSYGGNTLSSDAVYVLVSYGQNGYGGFLRSANVDVDGGATSSSQPYRHTNPPIANTDELANAGYDPAGGSWGINTFVSQFISAPPGETFDDIVRFKTRNTLVLECNLYANGVCKNTHGIFIR